MGSRSVGHGSERLFGRERQLWLSAAGWLLLIYSTLYIVRAPVEFLRERNLLRASVAAVFLLTAATLLFLLLSRRPRKSELAVFAIFGVLYAAGFASLARAEERLHLIEYGVLAVLLLAALEARRMRLEAQGRAVRSGWWIPLQAVLLTSAAGWGDELIQGVLPNRVYELRDVGINVLSAVLAVAAAVAWQRARGRASET